MISQMWNFKSKKFTEGVLSWSLWAGTVMCLLAGIALVYSMKRSWMDPSDVLAPVIFWKESLEQPNDSLRGGLNETTTKGGNQHSNETTTKGGNQHSNDTNEGERQPGHQAVDDKFLIKQTGIRGEKAVAQFRAHADCLSASGRWVYDPTPRKLPWLSVKDYNWVNKCDRAHRGGIVEERADRIALSNNSDAVWKVREELKWVWRTNDSSCPWHPLDRDDFCRRIGSKRNVLVVGDSINHEISVALQNALAMNMSSAVNRKLFAGEELCSDVLGGVGKGLGVNFVRNDYVSAVTNSTSLGRTFQDAWMPHLDNGNGDMKILILNRGAHYQNDRRFVEGLTNTFETLRDRHPELLVIYRNTPPGHVNCTKFHAPIPEPLKGAPPSFHWEDFQRQNLLAKKIVEKFQHIYVDVARPIGMRPEGHMHGKDCLHYCQPGPLDLAVEMIYNVLLLLP